MPRRRAPQPTRRQVAAAAAMQAPLGQERASEALMRPAQPVPLGLPLPVVTRGATEARPKPPSV